MRPIDADELKKDLGEVLINLMKSHETSRIEKVGFALDVVDEAETLDVAPVVYGRWGEPRIIGFDDSYRAVYGYPCSVCNDCTKVIDANYCPNCGAKMIGDRK